MKHYRPTGYLATETKPGTHFSVASYCTDLDCGLCPALKRLQHGVSWQCNIENI